MVLGAQKISHFFNFMRIILRIEGVNMRKSINAERLGNMLCQARYDSGKSQEQIAKQMGVARRTIQNWEYGYASPDVAKCLDYFDACGVQPLPYFLKLFYAEFDKLTSKSNDKDIENALIQRIKACSPAEKRKLLFIIYGDHGSSTHGIIEMTVAHLHVSLKDRLNICQQIILNYKIAEKHGKLVKTEHVLPDMKFLQQAFDNAMESVIEGKESYSNVRGE